MGKYDTTKEWAAAKLPLEAGHEIGAGCERTALGPSDATDCSTVLYFGCICRSGHYLWHPKKGQVIRMEKAQPWGNQIDGGVFFGSKDKERLGVVHSAKLNGWTLVAWADRSVDSRHGSHSTFIVESDITPERLIELAREQWPQVFSRPGFPDLSNAQGDVARPSP